MSSRSTSPNNRYGPYLGELLRAEGLNGFRMEETRCSVTEKTRDLLESHVAAGGQLIILAPETIWEPLIGLTPLPSGLLDGYLKLVITQEVREF